MGEGVLVDKAQGDMLMGRVSIAVTYFVFSLNNANLFK